MVRLDGEVITRAECEIGYLHRCFEKMSETHGWQQVIPYTDRLNYCSSMMNGVGYALAVERMLGIEAPPRAQARRWPRRVRHREWRAGGRRPSLRQSWSGWRGSSGAQGRRAGRGAADCVLGACAGSRRVAAGRPAPSVTGPQPGKP